MTDIAAMLRTLNRLTGRQYTALGNLAYEAITRLAVAERAAAEALAQRDAAAATVGLLRTDQAISGALMCLAADRIRNTHPQQCTTPCATCHLLERLEHEATTARNTYAPTGDRT